METIGSTTEIGSLRNIISQSSGLQYVAFGFP